MYKSEEVCPVCDSRYLSRANSYKHYCYICNDCNSVFHVKKDSEYFFEKILSRSVFKAILPQKAFLRLFHDRGDVSAADFYDVYAEECCNLDEVRQSEVDQLFDQLDIAGIDIKEMAILDISGGPGLVANKLQSKSARVVVTEFSEKATTAMADILGVEAVKFDYTEDKLQDIFGEKFDLILIRSSIIFCPNLDEFVASLGAILNTGGYVLVETIMPTLGDVFWWQQMEYKFPIIYSQETIEKLFYKHGFSFVVGYRDYGSYVAIKRRSMKGLLQMVYTWLVDYPMVMFYYSLARKGRVAIDQQLHHKMLTQIWKKASVSETVPRSPYRNYVAGGANHSTHFSYKYNGYLKS